MTLWWHNMDSTIKLILFIFCFFVSLVCASLLINFNNYVIAKSEWNCTKSIIIDNKNVDKVICVNYRKVTEED